MESSTAPRPRVLLVDDDADTVELLCMLVRRRGFEVTVARSVATALAAATATPIDVLVSDIGLPDGSGHDLLCQLRTTRPVPAIALTGLDDAEGRESGRQASFDMYLSKPVSIDQLVDALRRVASAQTVAG